MDTLCELKKLLKQWEVDFKHNHDRKPGKADIAAAPEDIQEAYKKYTVLKKEQTSHIGGLNKTSDNAAAENEPDSETTKPPGAEQGEVWGSQFDRKVVSPTSGEAKAANKKPSSSYLLNLGNKMFEQSLKLSKTKTPKGVMRRNVSVGTPARTDSGLDGSRVPPIVNDFDEPFPDEADLTDQLSGNSNVMSKPQDEVDGDDTPARFGTLFQKALSVTKKKGQCVPSDNTDVFVNKFSNKPKHKQSVLPDNLSSLVSKHKEKYGDVDWENMNTEENVDVNNAVDDEHEKEEKNSKQKYHNDWNDFYEGVTLSNDSNRIEIGGNILPNTTNKKTNSGKTCKHSGVRNALNEPNSVQNTKTTKSSSVNKNAKQTKTLPTPATTDSEEHVTDTFAFSATEEETSPIKVKRGKRQRVSRCNTPAANRKSVPKIVANKDAETEVDGDDTHIKHEADDASDEDPDTGPQKTRKRKRKAGTGPVAKKQKTTAAKGANTVMGDDAANDGVKTVRKTAPRSKPVSNDNFVRLNMKAKRYQPKGKHMSGPAHKRMMWKQKMQARSKSYGDSCFKCGQPGHWANKCPGNKSGTSLQREPVDDEEFPSMQEAVMLARGIRTEKAKPPPQQQRTDVPDQEDITGTTDQGTSLPTPATGDQEPDQDVELDIESSIVRSRQESYPAPPAMEPMFPVSEDGDIPDTPQVVLKGLRKFGYDTFRPGQEEAVMRILCGLSTLVVLSTGGGKSLCYQLAAYLYAQRRTCITLVVSPLVSLMEDQVTGLPNGIRGVCLHTNMTPSQREGVLSAVKDGLTQFLLVSPEAIAGGSTQLLTSLTTLPPIAFVCIDEAHCLSEWSHNFRPSYLRVCKVLQDKLGVRCFLGLTATATLSTASNVARHLRITDFRRATIRGSPVPQNLYLSVSRDEDRDGGLTGMAAGGYNAVVDDWRSSYDLNSLHASGEHSSHIQVLKKKPQTLQVWLEDFEWACGRTPESSKSPEDGKMETNEVNCAVTPASSKSSEDGKMGNDEATCGRIPELSKSSEDEKIETDKATYGWTPESSKSPEDGKMETNEVNCAVTPASSKSSEDGKMGNDEATCGRIPELSKSSEDEKIETDKATYGWTPESSKSPEDGKMETNEVNCAVTPASSKSSEDGKMEIDKATCAVTVTPASSNSPEDGKMGNDEDTCGRIPELSKSSEDEKIETDEATYGWTPESSKSPEDGRMETIEDTCAVTHESSNLLEEQIIFVSESVFDDTDGDGDYVPDSSQSGNDDDDECELPFSVITSLAVVPELSTSSEDEKIETDEATCGRIPESSKSRVDGKTETNEDTCAVTHESSNLLEEQIIFGSESEFDNTDRDSDYVPDFSQLGNDDDEYELPVSVIKSLAVVRELSTSSEDEKIETDEATCGRTPESSKSPDDGRMETNKAKCAVTPESSKSPENGKMEINKVTCAVTPESSNLMETDQAASVLASEPANSSEDEVTESNEAGQCCHNGLDDALKDIDEEYPDIYIRSNIKSKFSTTGRAKASDRVYNNYHCCFLCKKLSTNINKHFRSHKDNPETMEIIQLRGQIKEGNKKDIEKELKTRQALLRHKGDHFHNMLVKKKKKGELIISRKTGKFKVEEYGPCPKCLEWMRMESYRVNHQNICPGVDNVCIKMKKGEAINNSAVICGDVDERASKQLITEVYPVMTRDSVTTCAKEDSLIVALGNSWLRRSLGNVLKRKYYTSSRMRGAARLLQHLRNLSKTNNTMSDFLLPKYFDLVCEAALLCAKIENDDEEDLKSPSAALKIGFDVSRMTSFKLGLALRDGDKEQKAESEEFNTLMKMEWSTRVSRLAHLQLRKDQLEGSNIAALPVPEDLATLGTQIVTELKNMNYKKKDIESYRRVVMLTETRLLTYNKRRSGELEALTLQNYRTRAIELDEADRGLLGNDLTDLEMYLIKSQELIKIRGKNGKTVPVLVPGDCKRGLAFIAEDGIRKAVGVKTWNPYLFANTGDSVMRAYDSLKTISAELSLAAPERITSVSLRKYIATLSQVIDMKDHELEWLCNHLGHTASIHKLHYRSTSGFIERVNIGKLMILQDMNLAGKYAGQRLQDIDISEFVNTKQAADTPDAAGDGSASGGEPEGAIGFENPKPENWNEYDDDIEFVPKKRRTSTRQPWNSVEEDELRKLFVENFKESKKPGIKDCNRAIAKSRATNGQIHKRCWETIKKKMIRMMKETN